MTVSAIKPVDGILRLDREGAAYFVAGGEASLFSTSAAGGSARRFLGVIPAGGLMFGAPEGSFGDDILLAIPSEPQGVFALPDLAAQGSLPPVLAQGVAAWVATLCSGLAEPVEPKPRPDCLLPGAVAAECPAGTVIATHGLPLWIDLAEATADLLGMEPVSGLVPLATGAWLVTSEPCRIASLPWLEGCAREDAAASLARFNIACQELLPAVRGFAAADEHIRVTSQRQAEARDRRQVQAHLAAMLEGGEPRIHDAQVGSEPLIEAVRKVASGEGLKVRRPIKAAREQQDRLATLDEIARASGFRVQRVALSGEWWKEDLGSLVAMMSSGHPAALIRRRGGYMLDDGPTGPRKVDGASAAEVEAEAYSIVAPHKAGPLTLGTLIQASNRGSGADNLTFFIALVVGALLGQALPRATGFIFSQLVPAGMGDAALQVALLVLLSGIAALMFQFALGAAQQRATTRSSARAHAALWDRVFSLPLDQLSPRGPAELAAQAGAVLSTQAGVRQYLVMLAASASMLLSALALILFQQPALGLLVLAFVLVQLLLAVIVSWMQSREAQGMEQLGGTADSMLFQMINGMSKLRLAAAEGRAILRWTERFAALRRYRVRTQRISNLYESWLASFAILAAAALFAMIAMLGQSASATPISLVMLILSAFSIVLSSIAQLVRAILGLVMLRPSWKYARKLVELPVTSHADRLDPGSLRGAIEMTNVMFGYAHDVPPVLNGVSFAAQPGQFIAIVGASGSGKSTLARILLGLHQPAAGAVYIDGRDVQSLHPEALRGQIGSVMQDAPLPTGSIADIVRGLSHAGADAVWKALGEAGLADEVQAMPMGIHTLVTGTGGTLSGGQRQRLALARIFLQRPPLLILDEATSALDHQTQQVVMNSVLKLPVTRIVIAHRIATIREADAILVLEGGRIVQSGRYEELVATPGPFANLVNETSASAST